MVSGGGASASGDVTVIRDNGKCYMYCTGGGAWISNDLLNWTFQRVTNVPVAPHVVKYKTARFTCAATTARCSRRPVTAADRHHLAREYSYSFPAHCYS
jgi:hypothetical protein